MPYRLEDAWPQAAIQHVLSRATVDVHAVNVQLDQFRAKIDAQEKQIESLQAEQRRAKSEMPEPKASNFAVEALQAQVVTLENQVQSLRQERRSPKSDESTPWTPWGPGNGDRSLRGALRNVTWLSSTLAKTSREHASEARNTSNPVQKSKCYLRSIVALLIEMLGAVSGTVTFLYGSGWFSCLQFVLNLLNIFIWV